MKYNLKEIMTEAWKIYREKHYVWGTLERQTFGSCLSIAWIRAKGEMNRRRAQEMAKTITAFTDHHAELDGDAFEARKLENVLKAQTDDDLMKMAIGYAMQAYIRRPMTTAEAAAKTAPATTRAAAADFNAEVKGWSKTFASIARTANW